MSDLKKPETKLEKAALKKAKEDAIEKAVTDKKLRYDTALGEFIKMEAMARSYAASAKELREKLGLTDADVEQLL